MKKVLESNRKVGSRRMKEPRLIGSIVAEMLDSDSPLACAYHERLFGDLFPDTHLDVDLKLLTSKPGRMPVGKVLEGVLAHDSESHFLFMQRQSEKQSKVVRYPLVYAGKCFNVHRRSDGLLYLSFTRPRYSKNYTFKHFCLDAAEELLAVACLLEK